MCVSLVMSNSGLYDSVAVCFLHALRTYYDTVVEARVTQTLQSIAAGLYRFFYKIKEEREKRQAVLMVGWRF